MKYFSMFTGVGGFELGIQQAYERLLDNKSETDELQTKQNISSNNSDSIQRTATCVGFSEIDKYASQLLSIKWPDITNYGDATKLNPEQLPDFDLLVGGFPCQSFSIAGKRRGFDDTRGTLFFDIARILAHKKPQHLLLENVKGLLSHDGGRTFQTIIGVLTDLGYFIEWQVLNSKNFGVPQNRERVFIVGHLRGGCGRQVFPITGQSNKYSTLGKSTETAVARALTAGGHSGGNHSGMTIISKTVRSGGRSSPHGSKQNWDSYEYEGKIRRLTPLECERLQGFPDGWTEGFSDTQRYKMMGNAVTVNVIEYLIGKIFL